MAMKKIKELREDAEAALATGAKSQSMSLYAVGIPGIAIVTKSEQIADNKGDDENKPVQANPVTVETKVK